MFTAPHPPDPNVLHMEIDRSESLWSSDSGTRTAPLWCRADQCFAATNSQEATARKHGSFRQHAASLCCVAVRSTERMRAVACFACVAFHGNTRSAAGAPKFYVRRIHIHIICIQYGMWRRRYGLVCVVCAIRDRRSSREKPKCNFRIDDWRSRKPTHTQTQTPKICATFCRKCFN